MLRSSDAYSRSVPVRSAAEKVSVYWDDDEERELCITEEDMFGSNIELEMKRRESTRLKWICTPGDSGPEI